MNLVFVALFAALEAVTGFIAIPLPFSPIPIVLQNMMCVLTGLLMGPLWGTLSTFLFLALGAIGLPIFSGGSGGFARFLGPTGGFLYGYLIATLIAGLIVGQPKFDKKTPVWKIILATVLAFVAMYIPGSIHFSLLLSKSFKETMALCVLPYLPFDAVKAVFCILIAIRLRKTMALYVFAPKDVETPNDEKSSKLDEKEPSGSGK